MTETTPGHEPEGDAGTDEERSAGYATGYGGAEGRSGIDTSPGNDDLHGQAAEVNESSKGPGPGKTPGA